MSCWLLQTSTYVIFLYIYLQQVMGDGDDTSDESVESEWDDGEDDDDEYGTGDEEEEDSENGW
jgi:hypothetical protein